MSQPDQEEAPVEHHIWCNFFTRPVEDCSQCKGLREAYPYATPEEEEALMKKHFPDNVAR